METYLKIACSHIRVAEVVPVGIAYAALCRNNFFLHMPEAETSRSSFPTELEHLPRLRKDLKEIRGLRSRLKGQEGRLDEERYNRILKSYTAEIEELEPIVEELKEEAESRKQEMEKQLGQELTRMQDVKRKLKDPSIEDGEKDQLIEEKRDAEEKAETARAEIQRLKFYLTGERNLFNQQASSQKSESHQRSQNQITSAIMDTVLPFLKQKLSNPGIIGCLAFLVIIGGISAAQVGSMPGQEPYTWSGVVATVFWFLVAQALGYLAGRKETKETPIGPMPSA